MNKYLALKKLGNAFEWYKDVTTKCIKMCVDTYWQKEWYTKRGNIVEYQCSDKNYIGSQDVEVWIFDLGNGKAIVVNQGSNGNKDWATNLNFVTTKIKTKMKVHTGFKIYYKQVKNNIFKTLEPYSEIIFTGHSQGAGIATLEAENYKFYNKEKVVGLITLSSPRVGNKAFADHTEKLLDYSFRFTYGADTVPRIPIFPPYWHIGQNIHYNPKLWFLNPLRYISFLTSWPLDHYPDLIEKAHKEAING